MSPSEIKTQERWQKHIYSFFKNNNPSNFHGIYEIWSIFLNNSIFLGVFWYILFKIQKNSFQNRWNWYVVSCCEKNKIISGKLLWLKSPSVKTSISIFYWTLSCVQSFFALTQWGQKYYYVKFSYPYIFTNLYSNKDFHCFFFLQNFFFLIRFKAGFREKELKHQKYFTELLSCYSMLW